MLETVAAGIRQLLKVPPEPDAPLGAPGSVQVFRAAPAFFRYRLLGWGLGQAGALLGIVIPLIILSSFRDWSLGRVLLALEGLAVAFFLAQLVVSFLLISLDYRYRWYMITDRSLRIREGLFKVQERTMTFSNIQNVSIRQGPLQRFFGISDLEVRTAGGGSSAGGGSQPQGISDHLHLGYFRGVANAEEIRDAILTHLRRQRTSGLGDPDEPAPSERGAAAGEEPNPLAAGLEILAEVRALRQALS